MNVEEWLAEFTALDKPNSERSTLEDYDVVCECVQGHIERSVTVH